MEIGLKSFVSEQEVEQKKKIRQDLWEQKRKPDDPLECPEEEFDNRTLYERLKEQRDRKQEEFEESRKLKHCIKLLDSDEVEFLEKVDEHKLKELKKKLNEEKLAIEEFKKKVTNLTQNEQEKKSTELKKSFFSNQPNESSNQLPRSTSKRQVKLLANAVKRKASDKDDDEEKNTSKRNKKDEDDGGKGDGDNGNNDSNEDGDGDKNNKEGDKKNGLNDSIEITKYEEYPSAFKVLGVLPGLASYVSDSSSSDLSDSDDDEINSSELDSFYLSNKTREIVNLKRSIKKNSQ